IWASTAGASVSLSTAVTTCGRMKKDRQTTIRRIQPQIARPVAVSAGLRFSTVSVNAAIHGAYAVARPSDSSAMITISVVELVSWWVVRVMKTYVMTPAITVPATMNGLRTRRRSDSAPTITRLIALTPQYQLLMPFALEVVNPKLDVR